MVLRASGTYTAPTHGWPINSAALASSSPIIAVEYLNEPPGTKEFRGVVTVLCCTQSPTHMSIYYVSLMKYPKDVKFDCLNVEFEVVDRTSV